LGRSLAALGMTVVRWACVYGVQRLLWSKYYERDAAGANLQDILFF